jgi:hypothetical protein
MGVLPELSESHSVHNERAAAAKALRHSRQVDELLLQRVLEGLKRM